MAQGIHGPASLTLEKLVLDQVDPSVKMSPCPALRMIQLLRILTATAGD